MSAFIRAGVIGYPITHSKSPLIHNHWIAEYGLNGTYAAVEIAPERLTEGVQDLIRQGYAGFNVTVPHKQAIFKLCDYVDDTAKAIGAVNTVVIKDGLLHGTNTDAFGFVENVHKSAFGVDFLHRPCVVLGAGGMASFGHAAYFGAGAYAAAVAAKAGAPFIIAVPAGVAFAGALMPLKITLWSSGGASSGGENMNIGTVHSATTTHTA